MPDSLRILVVTNTYPTEARPAATPCVRDQVEALRRYGVSVDVLHIDNSNRLHYLWATGTIARLALRPRRYDLIHAHYGHCGVLARLQPWYPVVVTFHGSDLLDRRDSVIGRAAARFARSVIVMTDEMRRLVQHPDSHVIPFGVDTDLFRPGSVDQARRELGLDPNERLVLFPWHPGRRVKRFDIVEAAVLQLKQQYNVRLVPLYDKPRPIIARYMQACDAIAVASNHEGSPMAVREAMACGLPVVAVDVGDIRTIIEDVDGCYLCERDPAAMAAMLRLTFQRNQRIDGYRLGRIMGTDRVAEQVLAVYSTILQQGRKLYGSNRAYR